MKIIAVLQADLDSTSLGTRSRLAENFGGTSILRQTVQRAAAVPGLDAVVILSPREQFDRCAAMLEGCRVELHRHDALPSPWAGLVRSARKWSLDAWRGGLGGTTVFDEYTDPRLLAGVLDVVPADLVLSIPSAAPLFDPHLAARMIDHRRAVGDDARLIFTTAPPGVAGLLFDAALVRELAQSGAPVGWLFSYQPDAPRKDLVFLDACLEIPVELRGTWGRLLADTHRSVQRLTAVAANLEGERSPQASDTVARAIGLALTRHHQTHLDPLPHEVEIELTTDDPYPDAVLRPRGPRTAARGPIDVSIIRRIARQLAEFDDSLVVLGGFGEPLRHPRFPEVLAALRESGVYGLAVRTAAADLTDGHVEALLDHGVDVLNVLLDAWTPDLYGQLQSPRDPARASLEAVRRKMERVEERKRARGLPRPILVPEFTKSHLNVHEMEAFHDGWFRHLGASCITGCSDFGGALPDMSVINMAPPRREPCRRIRSRCLVLADGRVVMCDQDPLGLNPVGDLHKSSLHEIWTGVEFTNLRAAHREQRFDVNPLCARCRESHRP